MNPRRPRMPMALLAAWAFAACLAQAAPPREVLHRYNTVTSQHARAAYQTNLGPTGATGWVYANRIYIETVAPGSPADGVLARGDYLLGVNGRAFPAIDPRPALGEAITDAEAGDGKLHFRVGRADERRDVTVQLPATGPYSPTWPFDCPKSAAIRDAALRWLRDHQKPDGSFGTSVYAALNGLFLLSSPSPADQEAARRCVYARIDGPPADCLNAWAYGYSAVLLAEYYLATGDAVVLPRLKLYARELARGQTRSGSWCHGMVVGGIPGGYGELNSAAVTCHLALVLARECGLAVDEHALARANRFFGRFAGIGYIPYGNHRPWTGTPTSNGRNASAALTFGLLGDAEKARAFAESVAIGPEYTEAAHTGCFWGVTWRPLGVIRAGRERFRRFMDGQLWYYQLQRRWDGGLKYLPNPENLTGFTSFAGPPEEVTGGIGLTYALPWKSLRILGRPAGPFSRAAPPAIRPAVELFCDKKWGAFDAWMAAHADALESPEAKRQAKGLRDRRDAMKAQVAWTLAAVERTANRQRASQATIDRAAAMLAAAERLEGAPLAKARDLRQRLGLVRPTPAPASPAPDRRRWRPLLPLAQNIPADGPAKVWRTCAWTGEVRPIFDNLNPRGAAEMAGWYLPGFDDSAWDRKPAPFRAHPPRRADLVAHPVGHHSEMYQIKQLYHAYARLAFDIDDLTGIRYARIVQQNCHQYLRAEVYLNGYRVATILRPNRCELSPGAVGLLRKGRNCLAIYLASNRGHLHDFDFGVEVAGP